MILSVKDLRDALNAVLHVDPDARWRFVNHGSGTCTIDFKIDPDRVEESDFDLLRAHEITEECDEDASHEERVRELGMILDDEFQAHVAEHEARMKGLRP